MDRLGLMTGVSLWDKFLTVLFVAMGVLGLIVAAGTYLTRETDSPSSLQTRFGELQRRYAAIGSDAQSMLNLLGVAAIVLTIAAVSWVTIAVVSAFPSGADGDVRATNRTPDTGASRPRPTQRDDGLADEMQLEDLLSVRWSVGSGDSGTTCEQVDRWQKRYGCSILKGPNDIATGIWVRCPRPVTPAGPPAGCSYRKMTARQRCFFGVRSGIPDTEIWVDEAAICRRFGIDIG